VPGWLVKEERIYTFGGLPKAEFINVYQTGLNELG